MIFYFFISAIIVLTKTLELIVAFFVAVEACACCVSTLPVFSHHLNSKIRIV